MTAPRIAILDYGSGNLHSVSRAISRVGGETLVTGDAGEVDRADALVIPGVGHFGHCVRAIRRLGLDVAIKDFAASERSVFGVCVGMQVLYASSEEADDPGLGLYPGRVVRLPDTVKVPHMGWNTVEWDLPHPFVDGLEGARFYFVHSYAPQLLDGRAIGIADHGARFAAAASSGHAFSTQFHPEKSGEAGLHLYENFVRAAA